MNRVLKTERFEHHKRELDELEKERAALISQLAAMDIRIATKREEVAEDAPMAMLPDDIGVEILRVAYQHDFPYCRGDSGRVVDSPIAVSQVNRWWWRLALSLPQIWTCIHLTAEQPDNIEFTEMTKLYLERSKALPISIFCCCFTWDFESHPRYDVEWDRLPVWPRYQQAWQILMAQKERWRNCAIYALHQQLLRNLSRCMIHEDFPLLEYFGMFLWVEDGYGAVDLEFSAPRLRHLRSYGIDWLGLHRIVPSLCKNLTEVVLSDMAVFPRPFWELLRNIGSTVTRLMLSAIHSRSSAEDFDGKEPLSFPKLQALSLSDVQYLAWAILSAAPSLSSLHLSSECSLLTRILKSKATIPTIRHLEVRSYDDSALSDSADLLQNMPSAFPNVETLVLDHWGLAETLFQVMETKDSGVKAPVFPALRRVAVSEDNKDALQKLVNWRACRGYPLRDYAVLVLPYRSTPDGVTTRTSVFNADQIREDSRSPPIPQIPTSFDTPYSIWDDLIDRPSVAPWNEEWDVYDQFPAASIHQVNG